MLQYLFASVYVRIGSTMLFVLPLIDKCTINR